MSSKVLGSIIDYSKLKPLAAISTIEVGFL
jgi:hypothetical protein